MSTETPHPHALEVTTAAELMPRIVLVNRCVLLGRGENRGRILLLQRSPRNPETWKPDEWEFPGGKLDPGQSPQDALERELWEEARLTGIVLSRQAYADGQILKEGKYTGLPYLEIVGVMQLEGGRLELSAEHQDKRWCTVDEAYDLNLTDQTRKALGELEDRLKKEFRVI